VLEEDGEAAMTTATSTFFANLAARGHDPVLGSAKGTVRIDLAQGSSIDSWWVRIDDGSIEVSQDEGGADCIVRTTPEAFDQLASGHTGALAATLRGELEIEGDPRLLVRFQRLFPAPTGMPKASGARTAGKRRG
jgi:putative sterol carrier protein